MLSYLHVENFAVVEKVEVSFCGQLNILTGETGAGKSILIDAINLFLKKKVPEESLRGGASKLMAEALFSTDEREYVLRREVENGKSLCYINSRLVPFAQLQEEAQKFLNIYGQNDHTFLLNPANHRLFLDEFCRNQECLVRLSDAYERLKSAGKELDELRQKGKTAAEKLDFIDFQITEIASLELERGDDERLEQRVKILSSAEEILSRSDQLLKDFYHQDDSLYNKIASNLKNLDFLMGIYPDLTEQVTEINRFYGLLPEFSATLSGLASRIEYSEEELNSLNNQSMKLNRLKDKYKMNLEQLLDRQEELKKERQLLGNMDFSIRDKQGEIDRLLVEYREINASLRGRRNSGAPELCTAIEKELARLEMKNAQFLVQFEAVEPALETISDKGTDRVEFYFSSNPGQKPGQIKNVASGGELSRLMLVLKSMIRDESFATYIFDEIDSGIGGKTAEFVGEKLKRIARGNQVLCISHLPQIASFADRHFLITKEFRDNATFSQVTQLSGVEQVREIGRLMVGSGVNEDVLKAAENLISRNSG